MSIIKVLKAIGYSLSGFHDLDYADEEMGRSCASPFDLPSHEDLFKKFDWADYSRNSLEQKRFIRMAIAYLEGGQE